VKDAQGASVQGRIKWRRFVAAVVPAAALGVGIMAGMANGAIAAQFSVSNQTFKVSADKLVGHGFTQYGGLAKEDGASDIDIFGKAHPVATSAMASAELYNLCNSVRMPGLPISLVIKAGTDPKNPAVAKNLLIEMDDLQGEAEFTNIQIGRDASTLTAAGDFGGAKSAQKGSFGQQADEVVITNLKQVARSTSAGTFQLSGLHLFVDVAKDGKPKQCPTS